MYGCSQSTSAQPAGVNIAVEAGHEWQIQEIGFDGVEKYIRQACLTAFCLCCLDKVS